jgi:hypothetical protein
MNDNLLHTWMQQLIWKESACNSQRFNTLEDIISARDGDCLKIIVQFIGVGDAFKALTRVSKIFNCAIETFVLKPFEIKIRENLFRRGELQRQVFMHGQVQPAMGMMIMHHPMSFDRIVDNAPQIVPTSKLQVGIFFCFW